MSDVLLLSLAPRWLRIGVAIRAALDYMGDTIAKAKAHFLKHRLAAAILDNVMQQGSNIEVFITPSFKNQGAAWAQVATPVNDHDFRSDASHIASPYGVFDPVANVQAAAWYYKATGQTGSPWSCR